MSIEKHEKVLEKLLTIPDFSLSDNITGSLLYLHKFKEQGLRGSTPRRLFYVVKQLFEIIETVGSARIEGNHTTVVDYITNSETNSNSENYKEITNIRNAQQYIIEHFNNEKISKRLICEVHQLIVDDLKREGARHTGSYRQVDVEIGKANFKPPSHLDVEYLMDKLISFINDDNSGEQFAVIKIAIFHHAFTYIHPFDNGNGRVVRLLTLVLLLQFGFNIHSIFNPSAVFFLDRENYYHMLAGSDSGCNSEWIRYFCSGLEKQSKTVEKLADYRYLFTKVITPSVEKAEAESLITNDEKVFLLNILGSDDTNIYKFKAGDVDAFDSRRRTYLVGELKRKGIIRSLTEKGREYQLSMTFFNLQLYKQMRELNIIEFE